MHEMALMGDILNVIHEDAGKKGISKIQKVELIVGDVSNALPDALHMAFEIFKEQNKVFFEDSAALVIHREEAKAECVVCGKEYIPDQKLAFCPVCRMPSGKIISGETFQILSYEGRQ
ncbi:hydrogenase maturation nickel metallochaperone HypA [Mesobacillus zeae]|uniref:Hydrogenase maturation factor HypA n=1 Tax=Mesobacillus zeae TaxID=1917180 RepID=A0A398B8I4_9BACI|nr:hydrogenase maturation nickel metallochaperone HypA [Mesobacillus zeae]RID84220.1 hydrogenase maturation nickel metallochaperone HypA [Mesobacillus zeae]